MQRILFYTLRVIGILRVFNALNVNNLFIMSRLSFSIYKSFDFLYRDQISVNLFYRLFNKRGGKTSAGIYS